MNKRILLIEDDEFIVKPLKIALKKEGFSLSIAGNGESALEKLQSEQPDLILLDIILPKINGFEVLKKIRSDPKIKDTPVIILSNLAREGEVKTGLDEGANDYIIKTNLSLRNLVKKIKDYL